jgi:predicted ATPase/DNA-binding winged helix-turn-helix (wHTH) protein
MPALDQSDHWEIDIGRRELRCGGVIVPIGARTFEIIAVLVRSAGELVSKNELMNRVWPGAIVEENTLHVHISAVRKALGQDRKMLKTESGRGYRLLGRWKNRNESTPAGVSVDLGQAQNRAQTFRTNLHSATSELIGRTDAIQQLLQLLSAHRIIALTGPGGIGKTVLAQEVARRLFPSFAGDGWFVELSSLSDPALVPSAVASVLGLKLGGMEISAEAVARGIGTRKILLVLDNCEHLIGSAAELLEAVARMCPNASVLATSREVLRIEGEYVYRVTPLDVPLLDQEDASTVLEHSAVQLFIARTTAAYSEFSPHGGNLALVAAICRRLDGIPLAIELAATRAAALGLPQVASRLDDRFEFLTSGRRTALPRHQTLRATLAWSYELLPSQEQRLLCRLAIFPAGFRLDAAIAVMNETGNTAADIVDGIANLVAKSLITLDVSVPSGRWRLLETTRAYALERLAEIGEAEQAARHHAEFFRDLVASTAFGRRSRPATDDFTRFVEEIDNFRAALDWAFSEGGDPSIGVVLTAAYSPVWIRLSLMVECRRRVDRALDSLEPKSNLSMRLRMLLTIALGAALYHSTGTVESTGVVLTQGLELAESLDDEDAQLRALWVNWSYRYNQGQLRAAQSLAERYASVADRVGDPADKLVGDRLMGTTMHHVGNQVKARLYLEGVRDRYVAPKDQRHTIWLHYNQSVLARSILARVLWLQGLVDQAIDTARACFEDARTADDKPSLCYALCFAAGPLSLLSGDLEAAEQAATMLSNIVTTYGQAFWKNLASCQEAQLLIKRGKFATGSVALRNALDACDRDGGTTCYPEFHGALAEGLAGLGQLAEALDTVEQALARARQVGEVWYVPELLRIKGDLLLRGARADSIPEIENCFKKSLGLAEEQGALSWELRSAMSFAALRMEQNRHGDARQILSPVYGRFTQGFATADLRAARKVLGSLSL